MLFVGVLGNGFHTYSEATSMSKKISLVLRRVQACIKDDAALVATVNPPLIYWEDIACSISWILLDNHGNSHAIGELQASPNILKSISLISSSS